MPSDDTLPRELAAVEARVHEAMVPADDVRSRRCRQAPCSGARSDRSAPGLRFAAITPIRGTVGVEQRCGDRDRRLCPSARTRKSQPAVPRSWSCRAWKYASVDCGAGTRAPAPSQPPPGRRDRVRGALARSCLCRRCSSAKRTPPSRGALRPGAAPPAARQHRAPRSRPAARPSRTCSPPSRPPAEHDAALLLVDPAVQRVGLMLGRRVEPVEHRRLEHVPGPKVRDGADDAHHQHGQREEGGAPAGHQAASPQQQPKAVRHFTV